MSLPVIFITLVAGMLAIIVLYWIVVRRAPGLAMLFRGVKRFLRVPLLPGPEDPLESRETWDTSLRTEAGGELPFPRRIYSRLVLYIRSRSNVAKTRVWTLDVGGMNQSRGLKIPGWQRSKRAIEVMTAPDPDAPPWKPETKVYLWTLDRCSSR